MKIQRGSLLYQYLYFGKKEVPVYMEKHNICGVLKQFFAQTFIYMIIILSCVMLGYLYGIMPVVATLAYFELGYFNFTEPNSTVYFAWFGGAVLLLAVGISHLIPKQKEKAFEESEPGMFKTAYKAFKEKTCILVEYGE